MQVSRSDCPLKAFYEVTKVKATGTGKLLDSFAQEGAVLDLCSSKFNVAQP